MKRPNLASLNQARRACFASGESGAGACGAPCARAAENPSATRVASRRWLGMFMGQSYSHRSFPIELLHTFRADAMRELSLRTVPNVDLDLAPVALVVADLLAGGADRDQPAQGLDVREGLLQLIDHPLALLRGAAT